LKAFVESLLKLPNEPSFRNCFNKALLFMIEKGINVQNLVTSELFFPTIWKKATVYSAKTEPSIQHYNGDINDLELDHPRSFFKDLKNNLDEQDESDSKSSRQELFEMEFKYINMKAIEFGEKLRISRVLKECEEIDLFEMDSIRFIIDYKWIQSCRWFFYGKFCIYFIYMITLYTECDAI